MPKAKPSADFGKELKELESIVEWFEAGDVDLDKAITKFERGMELAAGLKAYLGEVENKVEVIKRRFDEPAKAKEAAGSSGEEPELF